MLDTHDVPSYVASMPSLSRWGPVTGVTEIGDGNINNVFRVQCAERTFVLKQSMPYVRIDPTWELTPTRIDHEAAFYERWSQTRPRMTPLIYLFDAANHALAVEDLIDHEVWRQALTAGRDYSAAPAQIGRFIAQIALNARPWAAERGDDGEGSAPVNPVMARLMEEVIFRFPYEEHPHNSYADQVSTIVDDLREDVHFRDVLAKLRRHWRECSEALIHGDLHTGSIMVAPNSACAIDAEFSTLGPIAWDLGELTGNLLTAQLHAHLVGRHHGKNDAVRALWSAFEQGLEDEVNSNPAERELVQHWLAGVRTAGVGYAGVELVRRVIGSGKADEIQALPGPAHSRAVATMLLAGREMVMAHDDLAPVRMSEVLLRCLDQGQAGL